MSYKKLGNYAAIFMRDDFNYISNVNRVDTILGIIRNNINDLTTEIVFIQSTITNYTNQLKSFYDWLAANGVPDIDEGYHDILNNLLTVVQSAKGVRDREAFLTTHIIKRLKRNLLGGLSKLKRGLDIIFTEGLFVDSKIEPIQIVRFIINKRVGLGDRYRFNAVGKHSFLRKAQSLNRDDVIDLLNFLKNPGDPKKTKKNGWMRFGLKQDPFRIPFIPSFGRRKIYALFKTNGEHHLYEKFVDTNSPKAVEFVDAA